MYSHLKYIIPLLLLFVVNVSPSEAQGANFWSEQEKIPEYFDSTEEPPYLVADTNHTVHAFNSQPLNLDDPETPNAVFYRQWTPENEWTYPNDILFDDSGSSLNVIGATADQSGRVHLIILKGSSVYYTQNYLVNAGNAALWPEPLLIAGDISSFGPGNEIVSAIATSPDGNELVVIYAGRQDGNGLYFTNSSDGGNTWSDPYPVYFTADPSVVVTDPKLFAGESGLFHAVWASFLDDGSGGPGYYSNFDPVLGSWKEPMELDAPGIRTPSVIETRDNIFVSYYHHNVNGNWWRKSNDNGKTWSLPEQISPRHIGTNGAVSFAIDSKNVLHAFFGERINDNNHGMWHVTFAEIIWGNLEAVVSGPTRKDKTGGNGFDPRSARAVIINGNIALVTWGTDGFAGTNGAWYSYKYLDAPEVPTVILEAPSIVPRNTLIPAALSPISTENPSSPTHEINPVLKDSSQLKVNPQASLFIGIIPVLLLLTGIIVIYYILSSKK